MDSSFLAQLVAIVGQANVLTQPKALETFSRDQYDFSPILKTLLDDKRADAVVVPTSSDQIQAIIQLCIAEKVPLTVRGAGGVREGAAHVLLEIEEGQASQLESVAAQFGGGLQWHNPASRYHQSGFALSDFTWNHTTLWAMKADPNITCTQGRFDLSRLDQQIRAIKNRFGNEILLHLEFIREQLNRGGTLAVASPVLVQFSSLERMQEIQDYFESVGIQVSDPHTYYLDGDTRWAGQVVLEGVRRYNPHELLNPGKIRALQIGVQTAQSGAWFSSVAASSDEGEEQPK